MDAVAFRMPVGFAPEPEPFRMAVSRATRNCSSRLSRTMDSAIGREFSRSMFDMRTAAARRRGRSVCSPKVGSTSLISVFSYDQVADAPESRTGIAIVPNAPGMPRAPSWNATD